MYEAKKKTAEEALSAIKNGSRIFIGSGCGEPQHLVEKLADLASGLFDVEIVQVLATRANAYTSERLSQRFRVKNFFVAGRGAREVVWEGRAEYIPLFISRVPRLFTEKLLELDCALIQVSPPNAHGYLSLGVAVDVAKEAMAAADLVIAQVNARMPVTLGDSFVHLSEIDALVEYTEPLLEVTRPVLSRTDSLVGGNVARLVDSGATIHAGLGNLPQAALAAMGNKTDLGVHTDMLTDGYLGLIHAGVITNRRKNVNPNRVVASYCLGGRELFDFVHMNPFVELYPISYTNDYYLIGAHDRMITIHEVMEADLTGLVCAASQGRRVFSGVGGLVDFMRGSTRSRKGKFIIALNSTNEDESESRILPAISQGADLMASRAATQYMVTEFGSVNLEAKSLHDRVVAMIEIAHPKFREVLYNRARDEGLLSHGDPVSLFKPVVYPQHLEKTWETDQEQLLMRPARASDLRAIQEFFYGLNDRDVYFRFLRSMRAFPRRELASIVNIDYRNRLTLLVLKGEFGFEHVVAIGRYMAVEEGEMVEVDVAVEEKYRRKGLGRALMQDIFANARENGFKGVVASVAHDNPNTLKLVKSMGYKARAKLNMGVFDIEMRFDQPTDKPDLEIVYPDS